MELTSSSFLHSRFPFRTRDSSWEPPSKPRHGCHDLFQLEPQPSSTINSCLLPLELQNRHENWVLPLMRTTAELERLKRMKEQVKMRAHFQSSGTILANLSLPHCLNGDGLFRGYSLLWDPNHVYLSCPCWSIPIGAAVGAANPRRDSTDPHRRSSSYFADSVASIDVPHLNLESSCSESPPLDSPL